MSMFSMLSTSIPAVAPPPADVKPPALRKAGWIPGGVAPAYLDGTLAGDVGFDPYCLVPLARTGTSGTYGFRNADRAAQMVMMSAYERKRKVMWMREAEVSAPASAATRQPTQRLMPIARVPDQARAPRDDGGRRLANFGADRWTSVQAVWATRCAGVRRAGAFSVQRSFVRRPSGKEQRRGRRRLWKGGCLVGAGSRMGRAGRFKGPRDTCGREGSWEGSRGALDHMPQVV